MLLLIRNCDIRVRVLKIYVSLIPYIVMYVLMQASISSIFNWGYFIHNYLKIVCYLVIYFFCVQLVIVSEIFICSLFEKNICEIMLCVYLYVSLLMCFKFDGVWTKVICYQGIFVSLGQRERGDIKAICVMNEIGILIVIITLIYILMVFRCRRKDYV